jgi:hypothetical protein
MTIDELLAAFRDRRMAEPLDAIAILKAQEAVLDWLVRPENNTDENCRKVDLFATLELDDAPSFDPLASDDPWLTTWLAG